MRELAIELKDLSYKIMIDNDLLDNIGEHIHNIYSNKNVYILTDDVVANLYLNKVKDSLDKYFNTKYVVIPHGEKSKGLGMYSHTCERLLEEGIKRNELLIALGGGVIGDLCGFIAATLYRGLNYVGIPTTLLSQVDSSIGGKTGIDFYKRKNILGCFKQPLGVFIDPKTLETLSKREFNNGMGELIKHGAIGNYNLLMMLKDHKEVNEDVIYESLIVKKQAVEADVYDQKERMTLNFGHTFGHVVELELDLKHGEAVALGMLMAIKLGIDLGVTNEECYDLIKNILDTYELPSTLYDYKRYLSDIIYDKKNLAGVVNLILLTEPGKCVIYPIKEENIKEL